MEFQDQLRNLRAILKKDNDYLRQSMQNLQNELNVLASDSPHQRNTNDHIFVENAKEIIQQKGLFSFEQSLSFLERQESFSSEDLAQLLSQMITIRKQENQAFKKLLKITPKTWETHWDEWTYTLRRTEKLTQEIQEKIYALYK